MNWRRMPTYLFAVALLLILLPIVSLAQEPAGQPSAAQVTPGAAKPQPAAVGVDRFIYDQFALSPDGKADFFIAFRETADLTPAYSMDWHDRGYFVVNTLKAVADRSQANVRKWLEERGIRYTVFWINNTLFVHADQATLEALKAFPEVSGFRGNHVAQIFPDKPKETSQTMGQTMTPAYPWNVIFPKADQVHSQFGIKGQGVVVGGMDTGVEYTHMGLVKNYRGCVNPPTCTVFDHTYSWYDPSNSCGGVPCDTDGHGTATMGIMVGDDDPSLPNGAWIGMAPDAKWIHCIGCPYGSCPDYDTDTCAQWFLAPGGDPDKRPQVVNHSWGLWSPNDCNGNDFQAQLMAYRAADILPAFAAGNVGNACNTSTSPANNTDPNGNPIAFASGAHGTDGSLDYYSSCGWNACNPTKLFPDVASPGLGSCTTGLGNSYNCSFGGTSSASPHTAGCVALVRSANPALTVAQVEQVIRDAADDVNDLTCGGTVDWNNRYGEGHLDCYEAVQLAGVGGMGYLDGHVTDAVTSLPIEDATVKATLSPTLTWQTLTDDQGYYTLRVLTGTYTVDAVKYGYQPDQVSNVQVYSGTTTTVDFALLPAAYYVVSGTVTDANTGWPLYARIQIGGYPGDPIWTDPETGFYSISLAEGMQYNFQVSAWVPGYLPESRPVGPLTGNQTENFALQVDVAACTAPGYEPFYYFFDDFEGGYGNWTMTGLWNPESEADVCGSQVAPFPSSSHDAYYGIDGVCTFDNGSANSGELTLVTPVPLPPVGGASLSFWSYERTECGGDCYYDNRYVEISTNGGGSWTLLGEGNTEGVWYKRTFDLSPYLGQNVLIRFRFDTVDSIANNYLGWMVDDVAIATGCHPTPGGLVVGNVYDANTSDPLDGAEVWNDSGEETVTSDGGFYTLFSPAGSHVFTATMEGYSTETALVTVVQSDTVRQDFVLGAGYLTFTPTPLSATLDMGQSLIVSANLDNSGTFDAMFEFLEADKGFQPVLMAQPPLVPAGPAFTPQGSSSPRVTLQPFQPRLNQASILHIYTTDTGQSIQRALNELGYAYDSLYAEDWTGINFSPYDVVIVGMDGGLIEQPSLQKVRTDVVDQGKRLIFMGGTCWQSFAQGVNQYLVLNNVNDYCWAISSTPHWTLVDPGHPLAEGLPASYNFTDSSAAFYQIRVTDPDIEPVAVNGDGYYNFFYKGEFSLQEGSLTAGGGDFIWFINSVYGGYWTNQADFDLLKQALYNAINLAAGDVPWLMEEPVSGTVAAGTGLPVTVTFDAGVPEVTQPGDYYAMLKVKNDTPYGPLQIPVTMTVVAPPWYGKLNGTVTGLGYCDTDPGPLKEAVVVVEGVTGTWTLETDDAGYYQIWLNEAESPLTVTVTYPEHETGVATGVVVNGQQTTTVDFDLRWLVPCLSVAPDSLSAVLPMGDTDTQQVTLTNDGAGEAQFEMRETDRGFRPTRVSGRGEWLYRAKEGVMLQTNRGDTAVAYPAAYRWQPDTPSALNVLVYADDWIHTAPNTFVDRALQALGVAYTAHYDGDFSGFAADLSGGGPWDLVIFENANYNSNGVSFPEMLAYVQGGGRLAAEIWTMLWDNTDPLYAALGVAYVNNDTVAPPVYWWEPGHNIFNIPQSAPPWLVRSCTAAYSCGQYLDPVAGLSSALAGYTAGPQAGQAALIVRDDGQTVFKGFADTSTDADADGDGLVDGVELWINTIYGLLNGFGGEVAWLSEDPISGTVGIDGGQAVVDVTFDAGAVAQPGEYYATLRVRSNDPENGSIGLPVTMTVSAPETWGKLRGVVSGLGYCDGESYPLEEATVVARDGHVMTVTTGADGVYIVWLPEGTYTVTASAEEHTSSSAVVQISGQQTTTQDLELRSVQPCISLTPPTMEAVLMPGESETQILTLINDGAGPSAFKIRETTQTLEIESVAVDASGVIRVTLSPSGRAYTDEGLQPLPDSGVPAPTAPPRYKGPNSLLFYGDRDTFNADWPDLPLENWEKTLVPPNSVQACPGPWDSTTNNACFGPGGILEGIRIQVNPNPTADLVVLTQGFLGVQSAVVGPNTFTDDFDILFLSEEGVAAVGMDILNPLIGAPSTLNIYIYGAGDVLLGETQVVVPPGVTGAFWGVASDDVPISRIYTVWPSGDGELVDNVAFGGEIGGDVSWLVEDPVTGTVEADDTFEVEVTFTALPTMTYGTYPAFLVVKTDDAQNPKITVPVTMTIVPCVPVDGVELSLLTTGTVYVSDTVDFEADILPDDATKPYSYTVDYGDGTVVTGSSSDDPLAFSYAYSLPDTYTVEIAVWNCDMAEPVTDAVAVVVERPVPPKIYIYLPVIVKNAVP